MVGMFREDWVVPTSNAVHVCVSGVMGLKMVVLIESGVGLDYKSKAINHHYHHLTGKPTVVTENVN